MIEIEKFPLDPWYRPIGKLSAYLFDEKFNIS